MLSVNSGTESKQLSPDEAEYDMLPIEHISTCSPEKLKSKLTVDFKYYPIFSKDLETDKWYCKNPFSTYEVERLMFSIIYQITYSKSTPLTYTYDNPVEKSRQQFLNQMNSLPERKNTYWCYYLTDENLNIWCKKAVEIFNKL